MPCSFYGCNEHLTAFRAGELIDPHEHRSLSWTTQYDALLLHGRCLLRRAFAAPAVRVVVTRRLHRLLFVYTPPEATSCNSKPYTVTLLRMTPLALLKWDSSSRQPHMRLAALCLLQLSEKEFAPRCGRTYEESNLGVPAGPLQ